MMLLNDVVIFSEERHYSLRAAASQRRVSCRCHGNVNRKAVSHIRGQRCGAGVSWLDFSSKHYWFISSGSEQHVLCSVSQKDRTAERGREVAAKPRPVSVSEERAQVKKR